MSDPRERRLGALRQSIDNLGLDALIVSGTANIRYLTGFTGSAGQLLVSATRVVLITDFRYATQAALEVGRWIDVRIERVSVWEGLRSALESIRAERVGIDRDRMTLADRAQLDRLGGITLEPGSSPVDSLRAVKDGDEVEAIRESARLAIEALEATVPLIAVGRTELEIAAELEAALRRRGSEWHPFPPIVASGPRAALPHARSTTREVAAGDFLLIDFGAQLKGYCSDITRTFVVGRRADEKQREIYGLVERAQVRARRGIRAGMTGGEADALARDVIERAGHGEHFGHSLGHGLGLEVHEAPRLSRTNDQSLPVGAVVTVEPGIYLEGWGGVRIEDDVLIGADEVQLLSDGQTQLVELI